MIFVLTVKLFIKKTNWLSIKKSSWLAKVHIRNVTVHNNSALFFYAIQIRDQLQMPPRPSRRYKKTFIIEYMIISIFFIIFRIEEFALVGYYLSNKYEDKEMRRNPPTVPQCSTNSCDILPETNRVSECSISTGTLLLIVFLACILTIIPY